MVGEVKWYLISYEDATSLIGNYETNTVTKLLCLSNIKDFGRSIYKYDDLLTYESKALLQK